MIAIFSASCIQSSGNVCYFTMAERNLHKFFLFFVMVSLAIGCSSNIIGSRKTKNCGRSSQQVNSQRGSKIVGGMKAAAGEFPWMVSFKSKHGHFCGGTVIHDRFILTAAHCFHKNEYLEYFDGVLKLSSFNITVGEYSLKNPSEASEASIFAKKVHLHPKYDPSRSKENDIALIEIPKKIAILAPTVVPVCLPEGDGPSWRPNMRATVVGWGKTSYYQDYYEWLKNVDLLQKTEVKIWGRQDCIEKYQGFPKFPAKSFICADDHGRESCTGDSGGPLLAVTEDNRWVQYGIIAIGNKCGSTGRPGVYTQVSDFTRWISSYAK